MSTDFPILADILFLAVTALLIVYAVLGLRHSQQKLGLKSSIPVVVIAITGWLGLLSALAINGFFADFMALPPRVMLPVLACFITIFLLAFNRKFMRHVMALPPAWLIAPQAFRILVEIVLWMLHKNENAPVQMSFEGLNFDILAGLSAPVIAYLAFGQGRKRYTLALVWNFISLGLLINILVVAVLSMPLIGMFEDPNTVVAYFPYILLPGFVAPFAFFMHVVSIRQLLKLRRS